MWLFCRTRENLNHIARRVILIMHTVLAKNLRNETHYHPSDPPGANIVWQPYGMTGTNYQPGRGAGVWTQYGVELRLQGVHDFPLRCWVSGMVTVRELWSSIDAAVLFAMSFIPIDTVVQCAILCLWDLYEKYMPDGVVAVYLRFTA